MPPENYRTTENVRRNPREAKALLLLSRVVPEPADLDEVRMLISCAFDWNALLAYSLRHGTSCIIYKNLSKLGDIPDKALVAFRSTYNSILRLNVQLVSELDRILKALEELGIETITLKGPTASEVFFNDIGLYPGGDIDLLIRTDDIDRTREYLESDGYHLLDKGFDEYRDYFLRELYHLRFSNGSFVIEPHWNLFYRYFTSPPSFWWNDTVLVSSSGRSYRFLSPERNILYNSFRVFSKGFIQLRFLVIVAEIIRHYEKVLDWEHLFRHAKAFGFEGVLRVILRLSRDLLGARVPGEYCETRKFRMRLLFRIAYRMALEGGDAHPLQKALLAWLRDDLPGAARVLGRRMFPSMGEIVFRYGVPAGSFKSVVYYVLNPLILTLRGHQK